MNDPSAASESPARSSRQLVENSQNAYAYGNPEAAKALLSTAFTGWLDGTHTLTSSTNLNSLQGFALIYMLLATESDKSEFSKIDSIPGASGAFFLQQPDHWTNGNGSGVQFMNTCFGNAIANFHQ